MRDRKRGGERGGGQTGQTTRALAGVLRLVAVVVTGAPIVIRCSLLIYCPLFESHKQRGVWNVRLTVALLRVANDLSAGPVLDVCRSNKLRQANR